MWAQRWLEEVACSIRCECSGRRWLVSGSEECVGFRVWVGVLSTTELGVVMFGFEYVWVC